MFTTSRHHELAYYTEGDGPPVVLIHGFASNAAVNWVNPGWVDTLTKAGFRTITLDNLGHGRSEKSRNADDYAPMHMAADVIDLCDHLGIKKAHFMGYSMGARIAANIALLHQDYAHTLILGGLGMALIEGAGDWDPVVNALRADDPTTIQDKQGIMFRTFADQTKSDRLALAACIEGSRVDLTEYHVRDIAQPTLIGVGTRDDIAGDPHQLADIFPNGTGFSIERRDHMLAVGDASFKKKVLEFLALNALS